MNGAACRQNKAKNVHKGECVNQAEVVLGSNGLQDEPKDDGVTCMKVIVCGSCGVTPLCCKGCSQQAVIQNR